MLLFIVSIIMSWLDPINLLIFVFCGISIRSVWGAVSAAAGVQFMLQMFLITPIHSSPAPPEHLFGVMVGSALATWGVWAIAERRRKRIAKTPPPLSKGETVRIPKKGRWI